MTNKKIYKSLFKGSFKKKIPVFLYVLVVTDQCPWTTSNQIHVILQDFLNAGRIP